MIGLHLPNKVFPLGELPRMLATGARDVLLYIDNPGDPANVAFWKQVAVQIVTDSSRPRDLHVRIERRGVFTAAEDARLLAGIVNGWPARTVSWRIRNEPNLESPGESPTTWGVYLRSFIERVRPLVPAGTVIHIPAVSPGPGWQPWVQAALPSITGVGFNGLDCHIYGDPSEVHNLTAEYRLAFQGPSLLCTETNYGPGPGRDLILARYPAELASIVHWFKERRIRPIYFIDRWVDPDIAWPTAANVADNPALAAAIKQVNAAVPPPPPGGTMPTITLGGVEFNDIRDRFPFVAGRTYDERALATITTVVQHHTGDGRSPAMTVDAALAHLDAIYDWHTSGTVEKPGLPHPWPSIGYHIGIDGAGRKYLLNGLNLKSYHAREANTAGIGVVWLADFSTASPPAAMVDAARDVYRALGKHLGKVLRYAGHYEVQTDPTTCPGTHHWPRTKVAILNVAAPPPPDGFNVLGFRVWLDAQPAGKYGIPRHDARAMGDGDMFVRLAASPEFPKGVYLIYRKWLHDTSGDLLKAIAVADWD